MNQPNPTPPAQPQGVAEQMIAWIGDPNATEDRLDEIEKFWGEGTTFREAVAQAMLHAGTPLIAAALRPHLQGQEKDALDWRKSPELPARFGAICLCRGRSYDAGHQDGYVIGYVVDGEWVTGKQQYSIEVDEWAELPASRPPGKGEGDR